MNRRKFLLGTGALLAAPAIVRVGSIMPVKILKAETWRWRMASGWALGPGNIWLRGTWHWQDNPLTPPTFYPDDVRYPPYESNLFPARF